MFVTNFFESGFIVPADPPGPDLTRDGRFRLLRVAGVEQQAQYTRVTVARLLEPDATVEILVTAVATVVMVQSLDDLDRLAVEVGGHMVDVVLHRSDGRYVADAVSRSARQY